MSSEGASKYIDEEDAAGAKVIESDSENEASDAGVKRIDTQDEEGEWVDYEGEEDDKDKSLMEQTMAYCRTRDFLKIFEDYIINHIKYFKDAEEEEHRLEWTKIFEDYLKLFEDVLAGFIDKKGGNYAQFYRECREKQDGGSPEEKHFLKLLLASADYQDFSRIMVREARYYYSTGISHFGYVPPEAVEMDDKYQDPRFAKGKKVIRFRRSPRWMCPRTHCLLAVRIWVGTSSWHHVIFTWKCG